MKVAILTTDNREYFKNYSAPSPQVATAPEALLEGLLKLRDVEIHLVTCAQRKLPAPEKLGDNLYSHCLHVPKLGWMRTLYLGCVRAVRKKLHEISPDIVHGQGTDRECAMTAVLSGFPNVITLHGIMSEMAAVCGARPGSFYWFAEKLENFALRRTAGVFCNSRFTDDRVRQRCRKTWRVPNAVRETFFAGPFAESHPARPVLVNVGTVCTYKRQNELIDVLDDLHREGLNFEAQFVGLASRGNTYGTSFLDRVQNRSFVSHVGFKTMGELIQSYDNASALVHVSAVETFGLVVAEALSRNLKLFAFKQGGVADIGENVDQAELVPEGDWNELKNRIARWIRAGFPRPTTAAATMRERYHPDVIARRHVEIYREVLNKRS